MDTYSFLRELADSWFLLAMFCFFIGAILFLFRPGSRKMHEDASRIPLRESLSPVVPRGCAGNCPDCIKRTK
ncbi:MAG: cbb3-type cytochrome c oxidase subunit 3 [Rhodobacteraceae bacterium]|nr:cbb3-type cytochrome c oxidase subunit 3 [Paracoccaceae bacterium]